MIDICRINNISIEFNTDTFEIIEVLIFDKDDSFIIASKEYYKEFVPLLKHYIICETVAEIEEFKFKIKVTEKALNQIS